MTTSSEIASALGRRHHRKMRRIGWSTIDVACLLLADQIQSDESLLGAAKEGIIPVMRGGLIPGTILSHMLHTRVAYCIDPMTGLNLPTDSNYLIVDDICDTGATSIYCKALLPKSKLVSLFVKPEGRPHCDRAAMFCPQDIWITFPWEEQ